MEFLVIGLDRPDGGKRRQELRLAHLEYVAGRQHLLKFGGPIQDDGGRAVGSSFIFSVPDRAALDAYMADDPYFRDGLFEAVFVRRTRQVVPEPAAGDLAAEIARQKAGQ